MGDETRSKITKHLFTGPTNRILKSAQTKVEMMLETIWRSGGRGKLMTCEGNELGTIWEKSTSKDWLTALTYMYTTNANKGNKQTNSQNTPSLSPLIYSIVTSGFFHCSCFPPECFLDWHQYIYVVTTLTHLLKLIGAAGMSRSRPSFDPPLSRPDTAVW